MIKFLSTCVTLAGGFAVSIILNRHFGKDSYGLLGLVYTVTGLAFSLSDLGTKRTLNRYLPPVLSAAEPRMEIGPLVGVSLLFQLGGAFVFSALIAALSSYLAEQFFRKPALAPLLLLGAFYFFFFAMHDFFVQLYQSFQDWKKEAVLSVVFVLFQFVGLSVGVLVFDLSLEWVLALNGVSALGTAILGLWLIPQGTLMQIGRGVRLRYLPEYTRVIGRFGLPLTIGALNFYLLGWADKALLGRFHPSSEVAVYYLGWLFLNGMMNLFKVLTAVLLPYVSEISGAGELYLRAKFQLLFRWFLHLSVLGAMGMFFLIDPLVSLAFGPSYNAVVHVFRLLLLVFLARGVWNVCGMFITNAFNLVRQSVWLGIFLVLANLLFNILLIPPFGAVGAAVSAFLAYGLYWGLALVFTPRIRRMVPLGSVAKALCAVGVVLGVSFWATTMGGHNPFLLAILSSFIYVASLLVLREVTPGDIALVREIVGTIQRPKRVVV